MAQVLLISTEAGSLYEFDVTNSRVRRLRGTHGPTPRQGADLEWRSYVEISKPTLGLPLAIAWRVFDGIAECTVTSTVVAISTTN